VRFLVLLLYRVYANFSPQQKAQVGGQLQALTALPTKDVALLTEQKATWNPTADLNMAVKKLSAPDFNLSALSS